MAVLKREIRIIADCWKKLGRILPIINYYFMGNVEYKSCYIPRNNHNDCKKHWWYYVVVHFDILTYNGWLYFLE